MLRYRWLILPVVHHTSTTQAITSIMTYYFTVTSTVTTPTVSLREETRDTSFYFQHSRLYSKLNNY